MEEMNDSAFATRDYHPTDAATLAGIYRDAILDTASSVYSAAQCAAWAAAADDSATWANRLQEAWVRVACDAEGKIAGFGGILVPGHIDLLFTAPDCNRRGVASLLLTDLLDLAAAMGAKKITVDASEPARGFFEKHGFKLLGSGEQSYGEQHLACHQLVRG